MYITHRSFAAPAPAIRDFFWLYHTYSLLCGGFYNASSGFGLWAKTLRGQLMLFHEENIFMWLNIVFLQGVKIRIVQTPPSKTFPSLDTIELQEKGLAKVRWLDMERLVGAGILHTKMWLVDGQHFFVGSPNQDWRALTQVCLRWMK